MDYSQLGFMVIDDDPTILKLVEAFLNTAKAKKVVTTGDAATAGALMAAHRVPIHCVICDYDMSPLSGLDMLRLVRTGRIDNVATSLCFVMLTASGLNDVVKAAIDLDVSGYVRKPFTQVSLLKTIDRSMTRMISPKAPVDYDQVVLPRPGR